MTLNMKKYKSITKIISYNKTIYSGIEKLIPHKISRLDISLHEHVICIIDVFILMWSIQFWI